ncbi:DUF2264 domain-containing protein [Flavihumibacter stibioxidans]|nr:DUF2264 domain-containing protein [Flavihumibacter stibioxidans]
MKRILIAVVLLLPGIFLQAQNQVFRIDNPDFKKSPYTGMTRRHWKDAALYMLKGAFGYIKQIDDPMVFPKQAGKSYPRNESQKTTEKLEGLSRTLFFAAPLLREDGDFTINGISVAAYYRHHIAGLVDPESDLFIRPRDKNGGPSQTLVEFGALALSLSIAPELLWDPLPKAQKDALAETMISYGDGPTVPSNWKFFNIFVLSFFRDKGYTVNNSLLEEYLQKSLDHYRGNGWYNDNPAYDYYSMWAFQMYGIMWSELYGKKFFPELAARYTANFRELGKSYPYMFGRDGKMIMWGRSMSYRFASIIPFPLMGYLDQPGVDMGWMRRISSGVLLQFLQHPEFLQDQVPTLGFYGAFEPAVQGYSCRGSVYWMGKAFMALLIPEENPFWTSVENDGAWETELKKGTVVNRFQQGSDILITDYPNSGAAEIRAWCNVKVTGNWEDFRGSENYNRLSYNSAFPWQADGQAGEVAMNYLIKNQSGKWEPLRLYQFRKFEDGVYYRDVKLETDSLVNLRLADIPLADGILRIDRSMGHLPVELRLGHYAQPRKNQAIRKESRKVKGYEVQIIDNGIYQLAMIPLMGWNSMETITSTGLHPDAAESAVINVAGKTVPGISETNTYASLMLWKKSGEPFTTEELMPVKKLKLNTKEHSVLVTFRNGTQKQLRYN